MPHTKHVVIVGAGSPDWVAPAGSRDATTSA